MQRADISFKYIYSKLNIVLYWIENALLKTLHDTFSNSMKYFWKGGTIILQ